MSTKRLAIVIPAYKGEFFEEAIASIAGQTCKDFTLYVGNDAGSWEIDKVVEKYKGDIDIVYKRFEDNLGGKDLVAEWNRVLSLMGDEPYFMFFSDDDVMEPDCIRRFYEELEKNPDYDVYHFNLTIINSKSEVKTCRAGLPKVMDVHQFYVDNNIYNRVDVRMPEFIFRTKKFKEVGGFVSFPLAIRSDNATVIQVAKEKGIYTIDGPRIRWRDSGINVGSVRNNVHKEKHIGYLVADISYDNWLYREHFVQLPTKTKNKQRWNTLKFFASIDMALSMKERMDVLKKSKDFSQHPYLIYSIPILWVLKKIKRIFVKPEVD